MGLGGVGLRWAGRQPYHSINRGVGALPPFNYIARKGRGTLRYMAEPGRSNNKIHPGSTALPHVHTGNLAASNSGKKTHHKRNFSTFGFSRAKSFFLHFSFSRLKSFFICH